MLRSLNSIISVIVACVLTASHALAVEWEVWLADQSNSADISTETPTGTFGSRILIYEGRDIMAAAPGTYAEDHPEFAPTVIEAADVFPHALSELGVNVERLHGMLPDPSHRYMNANFFGPGVGLVGIIDAEGQCTLSDNGFKQCAPIQGGPRAAEQLATALFRTTGPEGSAPSNHMSYFSRDGTKLLVANLGAKLLERIDYDQETGTFIFNKAATLDLVGGRDLTAMEAMADSTLPAGQVRGEYTNFQTIYTPSGALKEGPGRPNNVLVCARSSSNNQHVYLTLGGGGLFVVDMTTEPMSIVAEYTNDVISGAGCGGEEGGGFIYINAGVSASAAGADDSVFIMYRLPLDYPDGTSPHTTPNMPPPVKFFEEKTLGITDEEGLASRRDAHGMVVSPTTGRYIYQADRIQNVIEVFDLGKIINDPDATLEEQAAAHAGTIDLTGSEWCVGEGEPFINQEDEGYEFNDDPAPDSVDVSPDGSRLIVAFRGPHPVSVKHAALGSCGGLGVVTLDRDGSHGTLTHVFRTFLSDATGTRNLSDIHMGVMRIKGPNVVPPFRHSEPPVSTGPQRGVLENPGPMAFQSGIGTIWGWVCDADEVTIEINGQAQPARYGTKRLDTKAVCGDTYNGFELLFNWNLLGNGEHMVVAKADGVELGRATAQVTTLGQEFLQGAEGECVVADFPMPGETVTLEWLEAAQNFVITGIE